MPVKRMSWRLEDLTACGLSGCNTFNQNLSELLREHTIRNPAPFFMKMKNAKESVNKFQSNDYYYDFFLLSHLYMDLQRIAYYN